MFRTADAAGIEKLYLCGITPSPLDRLGNKRGDLVKASLGAEDYVPWEKVGSSPRPQATLALMRKLKAQGYTICAIEQDARSLPYTGLHKAPARMLALVVGNEVDGLPPSVLKLCDHILEIPMRGKKESLNVSVAFGIAAFELVKNKKGRRSARM
jgi:tRNA G18 (ribose-2'-O)-methylase SpoU